jgi:hypothetical protein
MSYELSWDQPQLLCAGTAAAAIFGADHRGTLGRRQWPGWEKPNPRAARYGPLLTLHAGGEGKKGGLSFIAGLVSGLSRG